MRIRPPPVATCEGPQPSPCSSLKCQFASVKAKTSGIGVLHTAHRCYMACRALSIVATNEEVPRDMFYNGDVKMEPAAVVCRVSPSFVRFGTFQLPVSRGSDEVHLSKALVEYVQKYHFPELAGKPDASIRMLEKVVARTAALVVKWQLIGFVHGGPLLAFLCNRMQVRSCC